jgi:hypothetical protein
MKKRTKKGNSRLADVLRCAADMVGRSPMPLIVAADGFGISLKSPAFRRMKAARDSIQPFDDYFASSDKGRRATLIEAAQAVEDGIL